jgi:hypothetical protein
MGLIYNQSNVNMNDLTYNHDTKIALASFSKCVGEMKAFAGLGSNPKMLPQSINHFFFPIEVLCYAKLQCALYSPPFPI